MFEAMVTRASKVRNGWRWPQNVEMKSIFNFVPQVLAFSSAFLPEKVKRPQATLLN
jgi:hypothetical protein